MSNLKGSDYEKQCRNAMSRLDSIGAARHNTDSRGSHSVVTTDKRNFFIRDFASYISSRYGESEKLNTHFTDEKIKDFLHSRMSGDQAAITKVNYARSFSSMVEGLRQTNVSASVSRSTFDDYVKEVKEHALPSVPRNRFIDDKSGLISSLYDKNPTFGYVAELQSITGLRVSEAIDVVNAPHLYIAGNSLKGIQGKGGQHYAAKEINHQLYNLLNKIGRGHPVAYSSYSAALKLHGHTSHDFRFTFVRERMEEKLNAGVHYREALRQISMEINHKRREITEYYLNNSGF